MMTIRLDPYTPEELFSAFSKPHGSINKHLLTIYSLAVGMNAARVMDFGIGDTTQALRAAMKITGGKVFSCDADSSRFAHLLDQTNEQWELHLEPSDSFLKKMSPPFDLVVHDADHEYWQVRRDLKAIIPMMRQFGVICIHDTQHSHIGQQMPQAIREACEDSSVAWVHLPFGYGLTLLRIEKSSHPPIVSPWDKTRDVTTTCWPDPMVPQGEGRYGFKARASAWPLWMMRRVRRLLVSATRPR